MVLVSAAHAPDLCQTSLRERLFCCLANAIAQRSDALDFDFAYVTGFEKQGWIACGANASGGAGCNQITRFKRHRGRQICNDASDVKYEVSRASILHDFTIDAGSDPQILGPQLIRSRNDRADRAGPTEIR